MQTEHVEGQNEAGAEVFVVGLHCLGQLHARLLHVLCLQKNEPRVMEVFNTFRTAE